MMSNAEPRWAPTDAARVGLAQAVAAGVLAFAGLVSASIVVGAAAASALPSIPADQVGSLRSLQAAAPALALLAAAHVIAGALVVAGSATARRAVAVLAVVGAAVAALGAALVAAGYDPIGRPGVPAARLDGVGILVAAALAYAAVAWLAVRQRRG